MWSLLGFKSKFKKGQTVEVEHPVSKKYVSAVVDDVLENSVYNLKVEGGEFLKKVHVQSIRNLTGGTVRRASNLTEKTVGTEVTEDSQQEGAQIKPPTPKGSPIHQKKILKQDSLVKDPSDSNLRRSMSISNSRKNSVQTLSRKTSTVERVTSGDGPSSSKQGTFSPPTSPLAPLLPEPIPDPAPVKKKKERKERGKEEILLLSRIRKCKDQGLRSMDISRLNLEIIPEELKSLPDLQEIIARKNNFKNIAGLKSLLYLTKLDLSYNAFEDYNADNSFPSTTITLLPPPVTTSSSSPQQSKPSTAQSPIEDQNSPSEQPETMESSTPKVINREWLLVISQLRNLRSLDLSNTQLNAFPLEIKNLTRLEVLHLRNNQITVIPEWIKEFPFLHTLDVSGNQIDIIPFYLQEMSALSDLNISNNPIKNLEQLSPELTYLVHKVN